MAREEQPVTALVRGLSILETFGRRGFSLTLAEVAQELGLPKSTVFRLLSTLAGLGYVVQTVKGGAYTLGPAVLGLGHAVLDGLDLREAAQPYLEALFQEVEGNVNLSLLEPGGLEVIYVARLRKREVLSLNLNVGSRLPVHSSSPGRVLAAHLPSAERQALLARVAADPQAGAWLRERGVELAEVLEQVRADGYAVVDGEYMPELFALAAPVWDQDGRAVAAVSMAMVKHGENGQQLLERLRAPVLTCAARVSALMGHPGQPGPAR